MPSLPLCVQCRQRPADARWRPFCSERCKMTDLGHWLSGTYRVPDSPEPPFNRHEDDTDVVGHDEERG